MWCYAFTLIQCDIIQVRYIFGEFLLLILIGTGGIVFSLALAIMFGSGPAAGRFTKNFCLGHSEVFEVTILKVVKILEGRNRRVPLKKIQMLTNIFNFRALYSFLP